MAKIVEDEDWKGEGITSLGVGASSEWTAQIFGNKDVVFQPNKGNEPNIFHRFMQRLCFGVVWVKD